MDLNHSDIHHGQGCQIQQIKTQDASLNWDIRKRSIKFWYKYVQSDSWDTLMLKTHLSFIWHSI